MLFQPGGCVLLKLLLGVQSRIAMEFRKGLRERPGLIVRWTISYNAVCIQERCDGATDGVK